MKTKLKQKMQRLFVLMLSIAMTFGIIPAVEVKAAEKITTISASTISILAGTKMSDAFQNLQYDTSKLTL